GNARINTGRRRRETGCTGGRSSHFRSRCSWTGWLEHQRQMRQVAAGARLKPDADPAHDAAWIDAQLTEQWRVAAERIARHRIEHGLRPPVAGRHGTVSQYGPKDVPAIVGATNAGIQLVRDFERARASGAIVPFREEADRLRRHPAGSGKELG